MSKTKKATTTFNSAEAAASTPTRQIYRVVASSCRSFTLYVEAESDLEALEIAEHVDGGYWNQGDWDDWEVDYAEKAEDVRPEDVLSPDAYNLL